MSNFLKTPLYRFWLTVNCVMGLFYVFVVPPFQSPDEFNHFNKIIHILEGHFLPEVDTPTVSLGGYIPQSLLDIEDPYLRFVWYDDLKSNADTVKMVFSTPLSKTQKKFVPFPNTARYTPVAYSAALIGCGIGWILDLNPVYLMYMGRLANLILWLFCIILVFKITPVYHKVFAFITLIPGTIVIQTTLSADVFTNGCLFIIMALFLKFKFSEQPISRRDSLLFWFLSVLTTWTKMVYLPFVFLLLLVPKERFGGLKLKAATMAIGLIVNLLVAYLWSNEINKMVYPFGNFEQTTYHNLHEKELPYVTFYDAHGKYSRFAAEGKIDTAILFENVNPEKQKQGILKNPVTFIKNFIPASFELYSYCNKSYVGSVGWESSRLNNTVHILLIVSLLLFLAAQKSIFVSWEKWSLLIVGHTITCAFLLSQILHWDVVGGKITVTYIGKYYIPIFMIFMFAFMGFLYRFDAFFKKLRLDLVLSLVIIIAYLDMIYITIHRFYGLF